MSRDMYRSLRHNRQRAYRWAYMASLKREVDSTFGNTDDTIKRSGAELESQSRKMKHYLESWADDLSGARLGRSIEDVEREAMNHLFGAVAPRPVLEVDPGLWRSPLRNIRNYLHSYRAPTEVIPDEILRANSNVSADEETVIDPITNRRVPKSKRANNFTPRYDDVDQYDSGDGHELERLPKKTLEGASEQSSTLHSGRSPPFDEHDSSGATVAEEKASEYEDFDNLQPVHWNEPDNFQRKSLEDISEDHQDFHRYQEASYDDTDQPRQATPKERLGSQGHYEEPERQKRTKTNGLSEGMEDDLSKEYNLLHNYQAGVHSNEPSGLPRHSSEERSKDYENLSECEDPVLRNEPDGLPQPTPKEESTVYQDLTIHREGFMAADDMPQHHEHSQKETTISCLSLPGNSSTQGEALTQEHDHLERYHYLRKSDPEGEHGRTREPGKEHEYLQKCDPQQFDSAFEPYSLDYTEAAQQEKGVNANPTIVGNEIDGLPLNSIDLTVDEPGSYKAQRDDDAMAFTKHYNDPEAFTAQEIRARVLQRAKEYSDKQNMEASKSQSDVSWDATTEKACEDLRLLKSRGKDGGMTGNYVRDFPEEFSTSWSTSNSASNSSLFPQNRVSSAENNALETEGEEAEISSMDESFPAESSRLQTAMSRGGHKRTLTGPSLAADTSGSYITEPQGLGTSLAEEVANPSAVTKHSQADPAEAKVIDSAQKSTPTKYEYVILAYDPSTQSIQHASTSSSVPDTSTPLSPIDILPRVSNPSKFLLHFDNLLLLGYEMVSGSGDVIIFRRTRKPSSGVGEEIRNPASSPSIEELAASELLRRLQGRAKPRRLLGRRLLYGTVGLVGGAYAVGVLAEYFSTGSFDGLSPAGL